MNNNKINKEKFKNIFILKEQKILMMFNLKVASFSVRAFARNLGYYNTFVKDIDDVLDDFVGYKRVMIVRDPYKRILSAYNDSLGYDAITFNWFRPKNKIKYSTEERAKKLTEALKEELGLKKYQEKKIYELKVKDGKEVKTIKEKREMVEKLHKMRNNTNKEIKKILSDEQYKKYEKYLKEQREKTTTKIKFEYFVNKICKSTDVGATNPHYISQTYEFCKFKPEYIIKIEDMKGWSDLGLPEFPHKHKTKDKLLTEIPEDLKIKIAKRYDNDFRLLGYDK